MKLKRTIFFIFISFIFTNFSYGDFKQIKKTAIVNKPEIIFPIKKDKKNRKYLEDALLTSIAGISAAMKNTG